MAVDQVTARTRVVFMIGTPIAQAGSPALFNRHFAETGTDRVVVPLDLKPDHVAAFFAMLRDMTNCDGAIVTIPHKQATAKAVDEKTPDAERLGLVNVVRREPDGRLVGDMTDGRGFWSKAGEMGFAPKGRAALVAGPGAAGTAICDTFLAMGGSTLTLVGRDDAELAPAMEILPDQQMTATTSMPDDLSCFDVVVNATPVGMAYAPGNLFPKELLSTLPKSSLVADIITDPVETKLLQAATALGLATFRGRDLNEGQFRIIGGHLGIL